MKARRIPSLDVAPKIVRAFEVTVGGLLDQDPISEAMLDARTLKGVHACHVAAT